MSAQATAFVKDFLLPLLEGGEATLASSSLGLNLEDLWSFLAQNTEAQSQLQLALLRRAAKHMALREFYPISRIVLGDALALAALFLYLDPERSDQYSEALLFKRFAQIDQWLSTESAGDRSQSWSVQLDVQRFGLFEAALDCPRHDTKVTLYFGWDTWYRGEPVPRRVLMWPKTRRVRTESKASCALQEALQAQESAALIFAQRTCLGSFLHSSPEAIAPLPKGTFEDVLVAIWTSTEDFEERLSEIVASPTFASRMDLQRVVAKAILREAHQRSVPKGAEWEPRSLDASMERWLSAAEQICQTHSIPSSFQVEILADLRSFFR